MRIFRRVGKRESSPYNAKSGGSPSRLESQAFTPVHGCWKNSPRVPKSPRKSHESAHLLGVCRAPDVVWESADRNSKACSQADKDGSWDCRSENRATNLTALFTMRKGRFYDPNGQLSVVGCPSIGAARRAAVVCASCAETAVSGGDRGCRCRAQRSRRTGISAIPSTGPSSPPHERMIWVGGHASSGDHERVSLRRSKRAGRTPAIWSPSKGPSVSAGVPFERAEHRGNQVTLINEHERSRQRRSRSRHVLVTSSSRPRHALVTR
jgi:hypothetical protein